MKQNYQENKQPGAGWIGGSDKTEGVWKWVPSDRGIWNGAVNGSSPSFRHGINEPNQSGKKIMHTQLLVLANQGPGMI
jgi:hypothetical protein